MDRLFNNPNLYPTSPETIAEIVAGLTIEGKIILDPSAGTGNIVDYLQRNGAAEVLACEIHDELRKILATKCKVIENDFFQLDSVRVSHIDLIIANPPFDNASKHILHMWDIAPEGCKIRALCNANTLKNAYSGSRERLVQIVKEYGNTQEMGNCFKDAERKTDVEVVLLELNKPASENQYEKEFEGFFLEDDPQEEQANGLMSYNAVRDVVNRYVECIKIYDEQLKTAVKLCEMQGAVFGTGRSELSISVTRNTVPVKRNEFKKEMQKDGWRYIFSKLNMQKYATRGLREDINKFIEKQTQIPFTMRNIYKMLEIIVGTNESRMDKALLEVFDKLTKHYDENRYNLEGWKTNSHYLVNRRFIIPGCVAVGWSGEVSRATWSNSNFETIEDFVKALCYITGDNYDNMITLENFIFYRYKLVDVKGNYIRDGYSAIAGHDYHKMQNYQEKHYGSQIASNEIFFGQWFEWGYFRVRAYKKGTLHMEFKDADLWAKFNQRIAKIKGYPLFENVKKTEKQKPEQKQTTRIAQVLFEFDVNTAA